MTYESESSPIASGHQRQTNCRCFANTGWSQSGTPPWWFRRGGVGRINRCSHLVGVGGSGIGQSFR
jgi:hypothetical protein